MPVAIVALPLFGFLIAGLFRKQIGDRLAMAVTTLGVWVAAALSVIVFIQVTLVGQPIETVVLFDWVAVGAFEAKWALRVDSLTAVMLVVVTGVSALVHTYSVGYMDHDPDKARFFSYLSLFTFAMLMLVTADNFLQLFFGWEGVGLASYLLIGFWYKKPSANAAAIKAFVVNRVGDFGFALGIIAVFFTFGSIQFDQVLQPLITGGEITPLWPDAAPVAAKDAMMTFLGMEFRAVELIGLLLFIGAMGKSAQFFLHVWLPDAMEGPTPVSALIHAATMVTAGVFLVCRVWPIYEAATVAAAIVTVIGAVTALYAATVGLAQNDIKRVVAYSTCSQLGYMFFAAGVGAYGAAMFHLFTHAFFKALLFLGAGAVIHALHDEQDMRNMGGVAPKMRWTWAMMIIGTLALTGVGIPGTQLGFAGFFSKDRIIEDAFLVGEAGSQVGMLAFWMGVIAAFLTSFYSWRLILMTFHGAHRGEPVVLDKAHEAPWIMRGPLVILSVGAVLAGVVFYPFFVGKGEQDFWAGALPDRYVALGLEDAKALTTADYSAEPAVAGAPDGLAGDPAHGDGAKAHKSHHVPTWVLWTPVLVTFAGFLFAIFFYGINQNLGAAIAARGGPLHAFLSRKWYFDELYNATIVRGTRALGDLFWKGGDKGLIDRLGPDGLAWTANRAGRVQGRMQSGYLYHYAFVMLVGVAILATILILRAR